MLSRQLRTVAEPEAQTTVASRQDRRPDATRSPLPAVGHTSCLHPLLDLQRGFGNRHVQRVVERARRADASRPVIQPKLVGPADDRCEREADRIADQVVGRVAPSPPASDTAAAGEVDPWIRQGLHNAGGGQQLPDPFRSSMERALGADLRGVRLHTDAPADRMNQALQAEAFTSGRHVFFRQAAYAPNSRKGQSLLAHELTHVVQQGATEVDRAEPAHGTIQRKMAFTSHRLKEDGNLLSAPKGHGVNTLFKKILDNLQKYEKTSKKTTELMRLQKLEVFANEWLGTIAGSDDPAVQKMTAQVKAMLPDVLAEIDALSNEQQSQYRGRAEATFRATQATKSSHKGKHRPFEYITSTGLTHMSLSAPNEMTALQASGVNNVTNEELAAIRVYTAGDYRYMNPVLANATAWLLAAVPNLKTGKEGFGMPTAVKSATEGTLVTTPNKIRDLQMEALQHARLAVSGLKKLPDAPTAVRYRGLTLPESLVKQYQTDAIVPFPSFTSTSTDPEAAKGAARRVVPAEVPVFMTLTIRNGKDVHLISHNKGEGEILVLPGAKFRVTKGATKSPAGMWEVEMTQVAAGGEQPGFGTSTTSAISNPVSSNSSSSSTATTTAATNALAVTPAPVPVYVASQGNSGNSSNSSMSSTTTTTTADVTSAASTSTSTSTSTTGVTQRTRGHAALATSLPVFKLKEPLGNYDRGMWIEVVRFSEDGTLVFIQRLGDNNPPTGVGIDALELATGRLF